MQQGHYSSQENGVPAKDPAAFTTWSAASTQATYNQQQWQISPQASYPHQQQVAQSWNHTPTASNVPWRAANAQPMRINMPKPHTFTPSSNPLAESSSSAPVNVQDPHLRTFLKNCLALFQQTPKETAEMLKKELTKYVHQRSALATSWEHESPEQFLQDTISRLHPPASSKISANTSQTRQDAWKAHRDLNSRMYGPEKPIATQEKKIKKPAIESIHMTREELLKKEERMRRFEADREAIKQQRASADAHSLKNRTQYEQQHRESIEQVAQQSGIYDELKLVEKCPVIIGTCQILEKPYLRLTSAPDPRHVRPYQVLLACFEHLKVKWREERDYNYICEQLKSIRQDLQVQRLYNEFAVQVYETHARIALERLDFSEFNMCQTQLVQLYEKGIPGRRTEFLCYRILYFVFTRARHDQKALLKSLTNEDLKEPMIEFALQIRNASTMGDFHRFFELFYYTPPQTMQVGHFLIQQILERERVKGLHALVKAHQQTLLVENIALSLGFQAEYDISANISNSVNSTLPNLAALRFINKVVDKTMNEIGLDLGIAYPERLPEDDVSFTSISRPKASFAQVLDLHLQHFRTVDIK